MLIKKYFIFLLFFLFFSYTVKSQQFNFTNYSIEHGVAQSQVKALFEDSHGYLWIGTDGGGISVFNGISFKNYTQENGLSSNQIKSIYEDKKGHIWIGTKDGYLCEFNGTKFLKYDYNKGLTSQSVQAIIEDKSGNLWIGTKNGLFVKKGDVFKKIALPKDSGNIDIQSFLLDKYGKIWIGTSRHGVYINENYRFKQLTIKNGLADNCINSISEDIRGHIWFATKNGVSEYDGYKFYNIYKEQGLSGNNVNAVFSDRNGNIWFGYNGEGVSRFNGREFIHFNKKNGLAYDFVQSIIQDRSGNLWFSTDGAGICKFDGEKFQHFTEKDGLSSSVIMSIFEDNKNNLWFGTYGSGLCKFNGEKFEYITKQNGLCSDLIYSMLQDKKGNLWFGSKGNGLSIYDGRSFKNYNINNGLSSNNIYSMIQDKHGNILIGTLGGGLMIYDGTKFTSIKKENGLSSDMIYKVFEDSKGNIWLATDDAGVDLIFSNTSSVELLKTKKIDETNILNLNKKFGLLKEQVYSIAEDVKGNIWFGIFGGGLCRFDGSELKTITIRDGLNSNNVFLLFSDSQGYLWAGTEKGLNRLAFYGNSEKPIIKTYGKSEGYRGIESNLNAVIEDHKGFIWFGNIQGASMYIPNFDYPNIMEPLTSISSLKLFYQETDWTKFAEEVDVWSGMPKELVLPYDQNHLTFNFTGIDYQAPEKVKYEWILEGFDKKWSNASYINEVIYSYIPPGDYTFKVKACNSDGVCNIQPKTFSFTIKPPFWKTWWFYTISFILVSTIIFSIIRWRINILKRQKLILEKKVALRTAELKNEKAIVEQQAEEIRAQAENMAAVHDELEKLSLVASKTDNSVLIANGDGFIEWVNDGFTKLYGFTLQELHILVGDNIYTLNPNETMGKAVLDCKEKKQTVVYNTPVKSKTGKNLWVQTTLTPILDENDEIRKYIAIDADISAIKLAEEEIKQQNEEIKAQRDQLNEAFNKMKDLEIFKKSFTSMIVHDMKNHLNSIITFSSSIVSEKNLKSINQAGKQMLTMVLNMLDVQKFEDTLIQLNTNIHNILTVSKAALGDVSVLITEKDLVVVNNIKPQYQAEYDYEIIHRVIVNILTNGIKYSENGGKITIDAAPMKEGEKEFIKISISDTGMGIPANMVDKVFDKFTQVTVKKSGGASSTGIGLTFCKLVVEAHGGRIWAESEFGKGATFCFTLPRVIDTSEQEILKLKEEEEKINKLKLNFEERELIGEYIALFENVKLNELSKNLEILTKIKLFTNTENIDKWCDRVENAIFNFNQTAFDTLLDLVRKPNKNK
jgi:PAS domain S-box-containing protein